MNMETVILTDEEIEKAFEGTNFGTRKFRPLLEQGVLKVNAGFRTGHTLQCIMKELGLMGKSKILKKGNRFVFWALRDANSKRVGTPSSNPVPTISSKMCRSDPYRVCCGGSNAMAWGCIEKFSSWMAWVCL